MARNHWLMKTEPGEFSIADLQNRPSQTECWDGVRNYQARNIMRDAMQVGDRVLFYHSGKNPAVVGIARVVKAGYPDHTAWDPGSKHYDPRCSPQNPIWCMVDVQFERQFQRPLTLAELKQNPLLQEMPLLRRGNRLSVQPVSPEAFRVILTLGNSRRQRSKGDDRQRQR